MKKIGITSRALAMDLEDVNKLYLVGTPHGYIEAVSRAGALPIIIPLDNSEQQLGAYLDLCDGLILTGGADIDPAFYDMPQMQGIGAIDVDRDESDLAVLEMAFARKLPIFGICRGCQLLNVYCGGTLHQDMRYIDTQILHDQKNTRSAVSHSVEVVAGSKLHALFGEQEQFGVNSFHHQACNKIGKDLVVTLTGPDGVVEGIEKTGDDHYVVGVQFHPEMFCGSHEYDYMEKAFKAFVKLV
ncbi:MAG: gamma-glutamyl-gamma-aminobutyrate hydrolase family protein [Culicoidibacterales bacterium]